jgi:hypothetical protein
MSKVQKFFCDYNVIDRFMSNVLVDDFSWFKAVDVKTMNEEVKKTNFVQTTQFYHTLIDEGKINSDIDFKPLIKDILKSLNIDKTKILRAKLNLLLNNNKIDTNTFNVPHIDTDEDCYSIICYLNDSDGDTFIFDEKFNVVERISPKKSKVIFFNSNIWHASQNPINNNERMVLNLVVKDIEFKQ